MTENIGLSVIIPVYNDPDGIRVTLSSLLKQKNAPALEILVVDNDSDDDTLSVISEFESKYPQLVTALEEIDIQSSYAARNKGIKHSSGRVLAFLDADESVGPTWAADVWTRFEQSDVDYLGCNVDVYIPEEENTFWARYDAEMGLPVEHYLKAKQFAPTCALAIRRTVVDKVGTFNENLVSGGDKEFGHRVHEAGFRSGFAEDIVVRHPARTTSREHVKKAIRIGRGRTQLWRSVGLDSHPFSPVRFLPPSPKRVRTRMRGEEPFIKVYSAAYLLKLVQTTSSCKEYL